MQLLQQLCQTPGIPGHEHRIRDLTLSCPVRYIHIITGMLNLDDLHACRDLLTLYLAYAK
ncbi:MAG: hypothetical protein FWD61_07080 [Phycisphaerales bacterium]|nr:hypothetical protein [Phycisphaerales bacterium]